MTQLLSLFNQAFGTQTKSKNTEQRINRNNVLISTMKDLIDAWIEARSEQTKYFNKHLHIE